MRSNLRKIQGWKRHLLPLSGLSLVRRLIGGRWEAYFTPPGQHLSWYPVAFFAGGKSRPYLTCMGQGIREDYMPRLCADCEQRPAAVPHDYCFECLRWRP